MNTGQKSRSCRSAAALRATDRERALPRLHRHGEVVYLAQRAGHDAVVRPPSLLPVGHEPGLAQHLEMEGEPRLRRLEPLLQVADALLPIAQHLEDLEA